MSQKKAYIEKLAINEGIHIFLSDPYETWCKESPQEVIISTKFHEDFLLLVIFERGFLTQTLLCSFENQVHPF